MPDDKPKQPLTVLVKKPDGTTVRVPLSQLGLFKKSADQAAKPVVDAQIKPIEPIGQPVKPVQSIQSPPVKPTIKSLPDKPIEWQQEINRQAELAAKEEKLWQEIKAAASAKSVPPAKPINKPVASAVKRPMTAKPIRSDSWSKNDAQSLLTEKLAKLSNDQSLASQSRENQVEKIVKQLDFTVAPDNQNRLRSIIQLRLKDIRDRAQTKETLLRPILQGGLGLLSNQAEQVLRLTDQLTGDGPKPLPRRNDQDVVPAKKDLMIEPEELPKVYHEPPVPAKSTPFNNFKHSQAKIKPFESAPLRPSDQTNGERLDSKEPGLKLGSRPNVRPVMRDITPVIKQDEEVGVGPIQEIQLMSLVDWRRLSANPLEAANRLKQKFQNLKDESYLLYLDGLKAWRQSPLFNSYMTAIEDSLVARKPLSAVTIDKNKIQLAEINALVNMEKEL